MGRIYKRGATWWGYWTDAAGEAQRRSLRTRDQSVARERIKRAEMAATDPASYSGHTLADAIKGLFAARHNMPRGTRDVYEGKARHLLRLIGAHEPIAGLTRDGVNGYTRTRLAEGAHPHSVHKELVVLRLSLKEAEKRGLWNGDARSVVPPVRTEYTPRDRWLTQDEAAGILARLTDESRRRWFTVALYTGMRASELAALRWADVDWTTRRIRVPGRKTVAARRLVPIADPVAAALESHQGAPGERVLTPWPNVRRDLSRALARATGVERDKGGRRPGGAPAKRERPRIETISPNDLRRTYASWLLQSGSDSFKVSRLLGHRSTSMVERVYGQLGNDDYDRAVAALPDCTAGVRQVVPIRATRAVVAKVPAGPSPRKRAK